MKGATGPAFYVVSLQLSIVLVATSPIENYVALIDAGSSGSRMHVFKWKPRHVADGNGVPDITEIGNEKKKPGLSSLAGNLKGVEEHLMSLVEFAKKKVPDSRQADTPIYLMATAGLRLVAYQKRKQIFAAVHTSFEKKDSCPFKYDRSNSRILSGEEEGVFSWISANFLLGRLTNTNKNTKTVGVLEMGGASTQIAFIPEGQILADKYPVRVGARVYSLYAHSYLYYGQDYTIRRVKEVLVKRNKQNTTLENPCLFTGDTVQENINGRDITFQGTSDYDGCAAIIRQFIYKVPPEQCYPFPCTIGNTYQPPLESNFFYAIVAFFYTLDAIGATEGDGTFTLSRAETAAREYCNQNLEQALAKGEPREFVSIRCLMGTYIPIFLHEGLGFPKTTKQITATKKINGKSIGWTYGAVIYEISMICYAEDVKSKVDSNVSTTFQEHLTLFIAILLSTCAINCF